MGAVFGEVPNLVNGVSQQAPPLRLPSQCTRAENFNCSLLDGLTPRPPTEHVANLFPSLPDNAFTHVILRDDNEKYVLTLTTSGLKVYDLNGTERAVSSADNSYINGLTNPKEEIRALTVADHTFIVNKSRYVAASSSSSGPRPPELLVYVMAGNYGKTYQVGINGVSAASYSTPDGSSAAHSYSISTNHIATQLYNQMVAAGLNTYPWAIGLYGSVIYLRNELYDFSYYTLDGYSNKAMKGLKGTVQKFADLPNVAPDGCVFQVNGSEETKFDNYWVKFVSDASTTSGVWKETLAPSTPLGLNASTMPHKLVRNNDGTFTFAHIDWETRVCGDLEKVPHPSFVGQQLADVFFHRNRLGFLTKENVVMSESGKFYNFYRTTLTALLDTDPIDVSASHVKVSILRHAVPYQDALMIFSDQTQFKLSGNELLTPKTVNARPISEIPSIDNIRPVVAASSIYFVAERDNWGSLYEYFLDKQLESADFDDVTSHCPAFVPAGIHAIAASPEMDLVVVATTGDPTALYLYKYFYNGQEKLQSAWSKWSFPACDRVVNIVWDKGKLLVLFERSGNLCLERINFEQRPFEDDGGFFIRLDQAQLLSPHSYDPVLNRTRYNLLASSFPNPELYVAVTETGGPIPKGVEIAGISVSGSMLYVPGNYTGQPIRVGRKYTCVYEFSPFFYRGPDGKKAVIDGRTQIKHIAINYSRTAFFKVRVTCEGREPREYPFNGHIIGDPNNITAAFAAVEGKLSVPVLSRNDRVKIEIINDTWLPCAFTSAIWQGTWNKASRER